MITYPIIFWQNQATGSGVAPTPQDNEAYITDSGAFGLELSGNLRFLISAPSGTGAGGTLEYWMEPEDRSYGGMPSTQVYWYYNL